MPESDGRRARSFGSNAADYAVHRPGFPAEAVQWMLDAASRKVTRVLDLAAGTGKVTEQVLLLSLEVVAVEPDSGMRAELTRGFPAVPALPGTAEHIPLATASVDAALVGQAFHWFDPDAALLELARVLRPGGALGVLWNGEDPAVGWVAGMGEVSRTSVPNAFVGELTLPSHPAFTAPEHTRLRYAERRTVDSMISMLSTHSRFLTADAAEREAVLDRVRRYLESRQETAAGEFDLPLTVDVLRARRR